MQVSVLVSAALALALVQAEPPVPNRPYLGPSASSARLTPQYGVPGVSAGTPLTDYTAPSGFGQQVSQPRPFDRPSPPALSVSGHANLAMPSRNYGAPAPGLSAPSGPARGFGSPPSRHGSGPSAPAAASLGGFAPSSEGSPFPRPTPARNYGVPSLESTEPNGPSAFGGLSGGFGHRQPSGFGVPSAMTHNNGAPSQSALLPSSQYGTPSPFRAPSAPSSTYGDRLNPSTPSYNYGAPSNFGALSSNPHAPSAPSSNYGIPSNFGAPSSNPHSQSAPSSNYGAPSNFGAPSPGSHSQSTGPSSNYGAPSTFGGPSAPSSNFGAPSSFRPPSAPTAGDGSLGGGFGPHTGSNPINGFGNLARPNHPGNAPAPAYGSPTSPGGFGYRPAPSASGAIHPMDGGSPPAFDSPSNSYGQTSLTGPSPAAPSGSDGNGSLQPQYGEPNAEDESSGPVMYSFQYEVDSPEFGTKFGHQESRDGDVATGSYQVLLPDGRMQRVQYVADENGYRPEVTYEDVGAGPAGSAAGEQQPGSY